MSCCNSINAQCMGMKADRLPLSNITASGTTITASSSTFASTDVGKTIILYDSVLIDWPTLAGSSYKGNVATYGDLPTSVSNGDLYQVDTPLSYYRRTTESSPASWIQLKNRESKAVKIIAYTSATEVEVDYTFDSLSGLNGAFGTDNFYTFQNIIYSAIDNKQSICIPNGDYMIVFSDDYTSQNDPTSKQLLRLFKGTESSITIIGESKTLTKIYYEYEVEWTATVYGIGIINQSSSNSYYASLNSLQLVGPEYKHKLYDIGFPVNTESNHNNYAISVRGLSTSVEHNDIIIDGGIYKSFSIGIGTLSDGVSTFDLAQYSLINVRKCTVTRCYTTGILENGIRIRLNVFDSKLINLGLNANEGYSGAVHGNGFYPDASNTFSFKNTLFQDIPRHAIGINADIVSNPVLYQEYINCKFINTGSSNTDAKYAFTKFVNCIFEDSDILLLANSCEIESCTFIDNTASGSYSLGMMTIGGTGNFEVSIKDCRFSNKYALVADNSSSGRVFRFSISNTSFESNESLSHLIFMQYSHKLILNNCLFALSGCTNTILFNNSSEGRIIDSVFDANSTNGHIYVNSSSAKVDLINNNFIKGKTIKIGAGTNVITGRDNYMTSPSFDNIALTSQKVVGRKAFSPSTIVLPTSFTGFLNQVNFNYDFYKLDRDSGSNLNINYIAFNDNSSGTGLISTGVAVYCGEIKLMAIHDPSTDGEIIIKHSTTYSNGNIHTFDGNDYTMKPNEVIEFYYDSDTLFWNMVR